ncbi:PREDICTED: RNA-binding protein 7 [Ipomoea nil]|uniref:RNA-binding protein 7 n=1 Tax=Ipomoea nil TaxID=35883 RepID=UPI000901A8AF|nr:PREDICTED: RNA-binding protein 7 [Ipomoea nil]
MAENANCTVYVGNLDERVSDRVLYDILIQAGRVVDLHVPRDRETDKPKGYAFALYETEEIAEYAVKLFSGLVTLYNKTLKFAISGRDKPSMNSPMENPPALNSSIKQRLHPVPPYDKEISQHSPRLSASCRFSEHQTYSAKVSPGVPLHQRNGYRSHYDGNKYDNSRRVFGAALDSITPSRSGRYNGRNSNNYYSPY